MKTLYDLLEIKSCATQSEIEQGYRRLLDQYLARQGIGKPDKETRRIQAIREAYLLLGSPERRQAYDQELKPYQKNDNHGNHDSHDNGMRINRIRILPRGNLVRRAALLLLGRWRSARSST
jgi:curved DNA-binding protein CbpA